jgi:acetyl-CoA C-acetyltransferase
MAGAIGNFAAMTSVYVNESGATPEQAARVAVKARRNALRNPHAHLKLADITVESVLASDMLAYPVRKLDMCPSSDGAAAVLFAADEDAGGLAPRPAWVHAAVTAHDQQYMGDSPKRLAEMRSLIEARTKGYRLAGIDDPVGDLDVAEIYKPTTYAELAMYECLGFCPKAGAGRSSTRAPEAGRRAAGEPVGGVLSTNPVGATALIRSPRNRAQVIGRGRPAGANVRRALATGYGGNAWST